MNIFSLKQNWKKKEKNNDMKLLLKIPVSTKHS